MYWFTTSRYPQRHSCFSISQVSWSLCISVRLTVCDQWIANFFSGSMHVFPSHAHQVVHRPARVCCECSVCPNRFPKVKRVGRKKVRHITDFWPRVETQTLRERGTLSLLQYPQCHASGRVSIVTAPPALSRVPSPLMSPVWQPDTCCCDCLCYHSKLDCLCIRKSTQGKGDQGIRRFC